MLQRASSNLCGAHGGGKVATDEFVVLTLKFPKKLMH